jgi:hypothetical protein
MVFNEICGKEGALENVEDVSVVSRLYDTKGEKCNREIDKGMVAEYAG